jgi:hypothetical protein
MLKLLFRSYDAVVVDDAIAVEHELVVLTFSPSPCSATFLNLLERIVTATHSTWS